MARADFVCLDGNNLAHRAWYAAGYDEVKASYTFTGYVRRALKLGPQYAAVAFDSPNNFRRALYPAYKGKRGERAPELMEWLVELASVERHAGVRSVKADACEADDVIATLVRQAREQNLRTVVFGNDRDIYALVSEWCIVGLLSTGDGIKWYNRQAVYERMGVWPAMIPALKALAGDTSDNIPGVRGIGPKRAVQLLDQHGSFEAALAALTCPPVQGDLETEKAAGRFAFTLVTMAEFAPVTHNLADLEVIR